MVGFVIVSHSAKLAEGVADLARMMAKSAPIAAAGGLEDGSFGTSFEKISNAIDQVYSEDGVILLMDMGSAVMTAEMVIESMEGRKLAMADCPIAEGAVTGTVGAEAGMSLEDILEDLEQVGTQKKAVSKTKSRADHSGPPCSFFPQRLSFPHFDDHIHRSLNGCLISVRLRRSPFFRRHRLADLLDRQPRPGHGIYIVGKRMVIAPAQMIFDRFVIFDPRLDIGSHRSIQVSHRPRFVLRKDIAMLDRVHGGIYRMYDRKNALAVFLETFRYTVEQLSQVFYIMAGGR